MGSEVTNFLPLYFTLLFQSTSGKATVFKVMVAGQENSYSNFKSCKVQYLW